MAIEIILAIVGYIGAIVSTIINFIQNRKNKAKTNVLEAQANEIDTMATALKSSEKYNQILDNIDIYINEAEQYFGAGQGSAKQMYVIMRIQNDALSSGISINQDVIIQKIKKHLSTPQGSNSQVDPKNV